MCWRSNIDMIRSCQFDVPSQTTVLALSIDGFFLVALVLLYKLSRLCRADSQRQLWWLKTGYWDIKSRYGTLDQKCGSGARNKI